MQAVISGVQNARAIARRMAAAPGGVDPQLAQALDAHLQGVLGAAHAEATDPKRFGAMSAWQRPLPDGFVRPSGITAQAANTTSTAYPVQWPITGTVVGFTCGTVDNTAASLGAMSVRITVNGQYDVASDGQAGAFLHFASVFSNPDGQQQWVPCCLPCNQRDTWQIYFRNESAAAGPFTPAITFAYVIQP